MSNLETPNKVGTGEGVREGSGQMFDGIAERYDLLNRIISLGIDQRWRKKTVAALQMKPGERVLDLACGTADLTMLVARAISSPIRSSRSQSPPACPARSLRA